MYPNLITVLSQNFAIMLPKSDHFCPNFALISPKFRLPNCPNLINFAQKKFCYGMRLHPQLLWHC